MNSYNSKNFETEFGGKKLKIETGWAPQANAAVKVTYGETVVLVTVVMSQNPRENVNFLPLSVEYEEKLYAAGRLKGSRFIKREGRATDEAILTGRVIDRIIRPRFDQRIRNEIQVVATVFSFDGVNDPDIPAVIGASLALSISDIPWNGPLGAVRVAKVGKELFLNPSYEKREECLLDLTLASDGDLVNMIELGANYVDNQEVIDAIKYGKEEIKKNIAFQKEVIKQLQRPKRAPHMSSLEKATKAKAEKFLKEKIPTMLGTAQKAEFKKQFSELQKEFSLFMEQDIAKSSQPASVKDALGLLLEDEVDKFVHNYILKTGKRPDGRGLTDIRPLACYAGVLPRTHGSAIFMRGLTHVLSVVTLAGPGEEQLLDGMEIVGTKRFMHHYNFPPYSVGETGMFRGPGRREIGHGALAEKALKPAIPPKEKFPYTIRVVSEVLSSNGSSSMASTCGSTLALLDAGVKLKELVAGIAMGLITSEDNKTYKILTDIQGPEDHYGDMDLKVAGSLDKITAIQMDVKIHGVSEKILAEAFLQAQEARQQILKVMKKTIAAPRAQLSPFAPKIMGIKINKDKIGELIGPGGKTVNGIIAQTNTLIDIGEDGQVYVSSENAENVKKAIQIIQSITKEFEPGEVVEGTVNRLLDFGAFVELAPRHDGLIHISKLAPYHVKNVEEVVKMGDKVRVEIIEIDGMGRINLKLLENLTHPIQRPQQPRRESSPLSSKGHYTANKPRQGGKYRRRF